MGLFRRPDPGPCPICGAAHAACTAKPAGPITAVQLPMRDAAGGVQPVPLAQETAPPPLVAERVQATLPDGQVTTGTYHRKKGQR